VTTAVPIIIKGMPATESQMTSSSSPAASAPPGPVPAGARAFASGRELSRRELIGAPLRWPRPSRLESPLALSPGRMASGMQTLGLRTVGELLEHLPRDHREARTVAALKAGEQATVTVEVQTISARPVRRRGMRPLVQANVFDATGSMRATFFNQPWLLARYPPGTRLLLHGKAEAGGGFRVSYHAGGADAVAGAPDAPLASRAVAHYPAAEGISSTEILNLVQAMSCRLSDVPEPLSAATRVTERLPDKAGALAAMHFPRGAEDPEIGRRRLAFEELLLTQLVFLRRRARRRARSDALALAEEPTLSARWLKSGLPFAPTGDQRRAIEVIHADLRRPQAMQRLLMGEVGSGKTVVALYAMLRAVEHGHQAALMAPTETLAEQHFQTIQRLIGAEPLIGALLTGSTPARRRKDILGKLASGELSLIVGTHAVIEPDVRFRALAVAVIDEQHRFGVRQRAALAEQEPAHAVHTLHMSATPIPRTLALACYGDLDTSTLRELPAGRQPVATRVVSGEKAREQAYEELREHLSKGRQAFVVCPLVEEPETAGSEAPSAGAPNSESLRASGPRSAAASAAGGELRAATAELRRLRHGELRGYELALLHGGMRAREKQAAMAAFASGEADVLVATTVIEVGIDVPNATVMLVENAERFGISQLHQLRGRVGRGEHRASCLLVGDASSARLRALAAHADGFRLAEIDLQLRKEGELVGNRQSGLGQFDVARMPEDMQLLERARACAQAIIAADPELRSPEHALLGETLERKFGAEALEPIPA
jgi:ATP-dependent DNA helicase RecG